jgi:hypothetical protein
MPKHNGPLPIDEPGYEDALRELVTGIDGYLYQGDRLEAILDTLRALRAEPELTAILLKEYQ